MIDALKIVGFKSLKEINIPLRPLTLLSGLNNSGKSSVIQALRMFSSSFNEKGPPTLEGHGGIEELRCKSAPVGASIEIGCALDNGQRFP